MSQERRRSYAADGAVHSASGSQCRSGGRFNLIQEIWNTHPDFFSDYRILPALAEHLDESYAELAELYMEILKKQGDSVVPLLKEGFDPEGKREMSRRVGIIAALEGAGATPWPVRTATLSGTSGGLRLGRISRL